MSRYALPLAGYGNASIWGYDPHQMTYFADLWRDSSDSFDDPDFSIGWFTRNREIRNPQQFAELIAARTRASVPDVLRAMSAAKTAPEAAILGELAESLATPIL
jgi:hypothetical protein